MHQCRIAGCAQPASSAYSKFCNSHRSRVRRQGDPLQRGIRKADLRPYDRLVRERIAANTESPVWGKFEVRWAALVRDAKSRVAAYEGGAARPRQTIQAAREVIRIADAAQPREVVIAVAAMTLMHSLAPIYFASDNGFDAQLVKRVRGLTRNNSTAYRDGTGRVRRVYHELPPRAAAVLAGWLRQTLGILGMHLARLEREEAQSKRKEDQELSDALIALK